LGTWRDTLEFCLPPELQPPAWDDGSLGQRIRHALQKWSQACPLPLVIFIDEIDALRDRTLVSVLRQLRDGYQRRPKGFPSSIGLIGLRDVRDYKVASGGSDRLNTSSPFNIKVESLTLRNFNESEVAELYQQHTTDTGQFFSPAAMQLAFELTQGQPCLVNALARQLIEEIAPEPETTITTTMVEEAKEILICRQDTHLDSLAERLQENRIKAIASLLHTFMDFWLQHGEALLKSASYPEIAPHLVLMAFLHRVINGSTGSPRRGGGTLEREYAIGRDRMDLCLRYGSVILGLELKVWRTSRPDPLTKGLVQLERYLDRLKQSSGWLVIFDKRTNALPLEERMETSLAQTANGQQVVAIRL
jgi:hypothetical protein